MKVTLGDYIAWQTPLLTWETPQGAIRKDSPMERALNRIIALGGADDVPPVPAIAPLEDDSPPPKVIDIKKPTKKATTKKPKK